MIIELTEKDATTGDTERKILRFDENEFTIWPGRKEKVKFLEIETYKDLYFLDMLGLGTWVYWDALRWIKNNKL